MLIILSIGFILLMLHGLRRGFNIVKLLKMAGSGVSSVTNIAVVMLLVGVLTALWRASGTIAYIVTLASDALTPELFLPATFSLCALVSVLTGTSIGTAATMGVICMSVGNAIGVSPAICGGAILSGAYFGDRCSPVSTSALLIAEITKTNLYDNIRGMIRTGWLATVSALLLYLLFGFFTGAENEISNVTEVFGQFFKLRWFLALPAISILFFALLRVDVKINMVFSIAISFIICIIQNVSLDFNFEVQDTIIANIDQYTSIMQRNIDELRKIPSHAVETFNTMIFGFEAPDEIAPMMNGGGMTSMLKLILVVLISLTYAGLFKGLGILEKLHTSLTSIATVVSPFGCIILTAIATCALACNQTLSIVLTNEICAGIEPDEKKRALSIENTSVIIAPLVPWTVASLVPLGTTGAPVTSIFFAFFLYLVPMILWFTNKKVTPTHELEKQETVA